MSFNSLECQFEHGICFEWNATKQWHSVAHQDQCHSRNRVSETFQETPKTHRPPSNPWHLNPIPSICDQRCTRNQANLPCDQVPCIACSRRHHETLLESICNQNVCRDQKSFFTKTIRLQILHNAFSVCARTIGLGDHSLLVGSKTSTRRYEGDIINNPHFVRKNPYWKILREVLFRIVFQKDSIIGGFHLLVP